MKKRFYINDAFEYDALNKTAIIARDGIYQYLSTELELPGDERIVNVWRPSKSIVDMFKRFKEMKRIPLIFEHPTRDLDHSQKESWIQGYGYDPVLIKDGIYTAIKCKLHMEDESRMKYLQGVKEISCGWSGDYEDATKSGRGIYEYIQHFDDFNHIALVPEGRCGKLCSIVDQEGGIKMKIKAKKRTIDSSEELQKNIDTLNAAIDSLAEEHREGARSALAGMTKFLKAEEEESGYLENEDETPTDNEEEIVVDETLDEEEVVEEILEGAGNAANQRAFQIASKDAKKRIADAVAVENKRVTKAFHDLLPLFANGAISIDSIKDGMTACEIKSKFVEDITGMRVEGSVLDANFQRIAKEYSAEGWEGSKTVNDADIDATISSINNIGTKRAKK